MLAPTHLKVGDRRDAVVEPPRPHYAPGSASSAGGDTPAGKRIGESTTQRYVSGV